MAPRALARRGTRGSGTPTTGHEGYRPAGEQGPSVDPSTWIDHERYPVAAAPDVPTRVEAVGGLRRSLGERGVAIAPGFLTPEAVRITTAMADAQRGRAHLEDVWGTPYLGLPEEGYPDDHPRRTVVQSRTWVLAADLVPAGCPVKQLFAWDPLLSFLAEVVDRGPLHRMDDPLGSLNVTLMDDGHVQGWHYDSTDFVVSIAIRPAEDGGDFECVRGARTDSDERYDDVAAILRGDAAERVAVYPMTPGTLMVFEGRCSLHRVSPVRGATSRVVGLLGYATTPGTSSSDLLKLVRYGRTQPLVDADPGP